MLSVRWRGFMRLSAWFMCLCYCVYSWQSHARKIKNIVQMRERKWNCAITCPKNNKHSNRPNNIHIMLPHNGSMGKLSMHAHIDHLSFEPSSRRQCHHKIRNNNTVFAHSFAFGCVCENVSICLFVIRKRKQHRMRVNLECHANPHWNGWDRTPQTKWTTQKLIPFDV